MIGNVVKVTFVIKDGSEPSTVTGFLRKLDSERMYIEERPGKITNVWTGWNPIVSIVDDESDDFMEFSVNYRGHQVEDRIQEMVKHVAAEILWCIDQVPVELSDIMETLNSEVPKKVDALFEERNKK